MSHNSKCSSSSLDSLSSTVKYGGLLIRPFHKRLHYAFLELFQNINQIANPYYIMHSYVFLIRMIQFIIAASNSRNSRLWGKDSLWERAAGIISSLGFIIPTRYRDKCAPYVIIVMTTISFAFLISCLILCQTFKTTAKLRKSYANFIFFFIHFYGYICQNMIALFFGEEISRLITGNSKSVALSLFSTIYSLIGFIIFNTFITYFVQGQILFIPDSLITVTPTLIHHMMELIIILCGVSSYLSKNAQIVIYVINLIFILELIVYPFFGALFVSRKEEAQFIGTCYVGFFTHVTFLIVIGLNKTIKDSTVVCLIIILILSFVLSNLACRYRQIRHLRILDNYENQVSPKENSEEAISLLGRKFSMLSAAITGMELAHPICLNNFKFFRDMTQKWPEDLTIWTVFAKFVAIYPEEAKTLNFIFQSIAQIKIKGSKSVISEIAIIQRFREGTLSSTLKSRTTQFTQKLEDTKQKLRVIWDLILQGNLTDMEFALYEARDSISELRAILDRLMNIYPNNRFVIRCQIRFLREIMNDTEGFMCCLDKIRSLQRGQQIVPDLANQLGIHYYPNLPLKLSLSSFDQRDNTTETETMTSEIIEIDDACVVKENQEFISRRIDELVVPHVKFLRISYSIYIILLFFVPIIFILLYNPTFVGQIMEHLTYYYNIANIRTKLFQVTSLLLHLIMENLNTKISPIRPLIDQPNTTGLTMEGFNGYSDTRNQLKFVTRELSASIEKVGGLRIIKSSSKMLAQARSQIFDPTISFTYYQSPNQSLVEIISLQDAISDFSKQIAIILAKTEIQESDTGSSVALNTGFNLETCAQTTNKALSFLNNFIHERHDHLEKIFLYLEIIISSIFPLGSIISFFVILKMISQDFHVLFTAFSSLPKSLISTVLESLRSLKKEPDNRISSYSNVGQQSGSDADDISKQEDGALKMFRGISSKTSQTTTINKLICGSIFVFIGQALGFIFGLTLFRSENDRFNENLPHIDYMLGSYGYQAGAILPFMMMLFYREGYRQIPLSIEYVNSMTLSLLNFATQSYSYARFGDSKGIVNPYSKISSALEQFSSSSNCESFPDGDFERFAECSSPDALIFILDPIIKKQIREISLPTSQIRAFDPLYAKLYDYYTIKIYEKYYYPLFSNIITNFYKEVSSPINTYYPIIIIALLFVFIGYILIMFYLHGFNELVKFALRQILTCPQINLDSTPKLAACLNGDFTELHDGRIFDDKIYQKTINLIPDPILLVSKTGNNKSEVTSANLAAQNLFGLPENLPSTPGNEISIENLLSTFKISSQYGNFDPFLNVKSQMVEVSKTDNENHVMLYKLFIQKYNSNQYSFTFIDSTENEELQLEIDKEKFKVEHLLSTILPSNLIKRAIQDEEDTLSQEVQSASISVIKAVFSGDPQKPEESLAYMDSLTLLFGLFDSFVLKFNTLTKVKTIGEKYIIAGGIFSLVNQQGVHAREATQFCLEAIEAAQNMSKDERFLGHVQAGIHTGGPVITGVIRIGKPSFEVIGNPMIVADELQENSAPMQILITRSVYELIYGSNFKVKERGNVEIKNGSVFTYSVSEK